jgi:exodeoxyribonuclease VII large subunit
MNRRLTDLTHRYRRVLDRLEPIIQRITPHRVLLSRTVKVHEAEKRLRFAVSQTLVGAERFLNRRTRRLEGASPAHRILRHADHLQRTADAIAAATRHRLAMSCERVRRQEERLGAMGYESVLARGFSITRIKKGREVVRSLNQLRDRRRLVSRIADGEFESEVVNLNQLELFD